MPLFVLLTLIVLHALVALPLSASLLRQRFEPGAMLVWLLLILFVPFVGALAYARMGENRVMLRAQRKRGTCGRPRIPAGEWVEKTATLGTFRTAAEVGTKLAGALVTRGNRYALYSDSDAIHESWKEAIRGANESIHMEYYIWWPDETGTELRDLLIERAAAGITCRVLMDAVGSLTQNQTFLQPFLDAGVHVAFFLPLATWKRRWSPHLRNHRKILVVDGSIGFIGSQNVSDDDRGRNPRYPLWHNVHMQLEGPAVNHLQAIFLDDWRFASEETPTDHPAPIPLSEDNGHAVQILPTGPDCQDHVLERLLLEAFNGARQTLDIVTPYFVPSPVLRMALLQAALRGVRVRIVIPSSTDQPLALYAGRSFYAELLEEGVEIYEYSTGMIHSKLIVVDTAWSMVGSANLDYRSLRLNFEVSALLYDAEPAEELTRIIDGYAETATQVVEADLARKRTFRHILEGAARVLSPQL